MGFIERTYRNTIDFLNAIGETQFVQVAGEVALTAQILSAIVVILVLINMGTQSYRIDASESIALMIKVVLIALFLQNWTQFNSVLNALYSVFDGVSNSLLQSSLGTTEETSFAEQLDDLGENFAEFANVTSGRLNILGAVINGLMLVFIAIFGALSTLVLIAARVILTVLISIAPLAIAASLSRPTKSYFESWLSAVVTMLITPVVITGIFAAVVAMGNATIAGLNPNDTNVLGDITPVLMVLVLSSLMVILTPFIVTLISGNIQLGGVIRGGGKAAGSAGASAGKGAINAGKGMIGGARGNAPSDKAGWAEKTGNKMGGAARDTAGFFKGGGAMEKAQNEGRDRIAQLDRMSDRVNRFAARRKS